MVLLTGIRLVVVRWPTRLVRQGPQTGARYIGAVYAVRATGLVKRFSDTTALDGLDIGLAPGEVRGLLGPNGAGKTTLLRILFGLIRPDGGTVELLGRRLDHLGGDVLDGVGGFVEEPSFYPYLTGRANLKLLAKLDGDGRPAREIDDALGRVGLAERAGDRLSGYSTGMRQRLGLAAALLRRPRLLLLDEPTSGLDPGGTRAVAGLVRELAADGVAVLLSSHQIGELEKVCDSYTVMRVGRVVWNGTAAELEAQAPDSAYALWTSDDAHALELASRIPRVRIQRAARGGLAVAARSGDMDVLVAALGDARVLIRRLELMISPLESMFFALTGGHDGPPLDALEPQEMADTILAGA
ncbi:MAG: ATP-binding cassette domain-containing protein [Solirubrobacterales bacterium]|nr:ATP-binding cassette domain-containing protein [Solirubrobacterales bacterium]